jgi:predicted small secreted protein
MKKIALLAIVIVLAVLLTGCPVNRNGNGNGNDNGNTDTTSDVQITYIFYDGLVYQVEADEYVEIKNFGNAPQALKGWVLKDISEGYPSFTFPSYILTPGESIRVYTNEYHSEWGGFSFGYGRAIWNNRYPDIAALYNTEGEEISRKSY